MHKLVSGLAAAAALLCGARRSDNRPRTPRPRSIRAIAPRATTRTSRRAPTRDGFAAMAPEQILAALESGSMISMGLTMSTDERRQLSEFLAGERLGVALETAPPVAAMCSAAAAPLTVGATRWHGWGVDVRNTRFQAGCGRGADRGGSAATRAEVGFRAAGRQSRLRAANRRRGSSVLRQRGWQGVFARRRDRMRALVLRRGRQRSFGDQRWPTIGGRAAIVFGDQRAVMHALDAATGQALWQARVDDFPTARITGSPVLHAGRLYVPVASGEEATGAVPTYECCKFRGSLVALDAATGKQLWKTYTIGEARPTKKNAVGTQLWGPSGSPIWSSPAIDPERNAVYVTTGNNYTDPTTELSDAFVALDLDTGAILWSKQMTADDAYTAACRMTDRTNCADANGPDFDFGASPILVDLGRRPASADRGAEVRRRLRARPRQEGRAALGTAGRQGRVDGRRAVGFRRRRNQPLCRGLGHQPHSGAERLGDRRRPECRRRDVCAAAARRSAGVVHAAEQVRRAAALQPCATGCSDRDSRRRVLGIHGRSHPRLLRVRRQGDLGLRHGAQLSRR